MLVKLTEDINQIKSAQIPHELFTVNTVIVNLFLSLGMIKLFDLSMYLSISISIALSLCIIAYTYHQTNNAKKHNAGLVYLHWQLSLNRYKSLVIAYVFYFIISSIPLLIPPSTATMDGTSIAGSIFTLLAIVPLFFTILVVVILGSGSLFNAGRGEIDQATIDKYKDILT